MMALVWRLHQLLIVYLLTAFVNCALVLRTNTITVKVGRTVYLNNGDILLKKVKKGDEGCRVEVVQTDPITQRVGQLEPKIFDCSFPDKTVHYIHSGSPLLSEDKVMLRVYRFSSKKTFSERFFLNIKVTNATSDIAVTRGLRHVIVPEINGLSNIIDSSVIRFYHSPSPNVSCTVSFNKTSSPWPLVGHIVMGDQQTFIEAAKTSCQEFLYMELRYAHQQKPTVDVDYLPLSIELLDPEKSEDIVTERFFLPIYIKNALFNSPPRSSFMSVYMMDVDQFVMTTILPGIISAEDYETPDHLLVYNITKPPKIGQGYFVHINDQTTEILSFMQADLENHNIAYRPPNESYAERKIYEVEFKVYDSHFVESMPVVLHIAVRPSSSQAMRVTINTCLVLLEGQSREISISNFNVIGSSDYENTEIYINGGMEHGHIYVKGNEASFFTFSDLINGDVTYTHDDSETTKDDIDFKITTDIGNEIFLKFPITIIPKDDSAPNIVVNSVLELNEGQTKRIDSTLLLARDVDSMTSSITFRITQPTEAGEIIRRSRGSGTGIRVNRFTQIDILKGLIYYRHFGRENFQDEFLFTVHDQQDPPNESTVETFQIAINPVNENPPQVSPAATRLMRIREIDITPITKIELEYTDTDTDSNKLTYIITTPPHFVYSTKRDKHEDAGKIIAIRNFTIIRKSRDVPAVETFKQEDINYLKIGYMPPMKDIGPEPRLVRFVYAVQDSSGNKVLGQQFDIDVQPVNDKAPVFIFSKLLVEEGGILVILSTHLSASDIDTNEEYLVFTIEELPGHGRIQKGGVNLEEKDTFVISDIRRKDIRYIHDGSEVTIDEFTLSLHDGDNRVSKVFAIDIVPINDVSPRVRENLRPQLIVSEGSEAVISTNVLAATDENSDGGSLVFLIVKRPKHGIIQVRGEAATKFTQQDIQDEVVHYLHSSGEIGSVAVKDTAAFIVSDKHYTTPSGNLQYILNITITPVDNQKPIIIAGLPIAVDEGTKFKFSPDFMTAKDSDTEPDLIKFVIIRQPQWGYLENIKPHQGSDKSNAGTPITSFKLQDIIDKSINYVQATHKGVEPTKDSFQVYATDGRHNSLSHNAEIAINPVNDEEPDVMLNNIHVFEGGSMVIDQAMLDAIDMDKPKEKIMLSISQHPEHGDIVMIRNTQNGRIEAVVSDFSTDEIHDGMKLKYTHDGTEHFTDKFAITVSDGKHEIKKVCNITIDPVNDEKPEIVKNSGIQIEYREQAILSNSVLRSIDLDSTDDHIYYTVFTAPKKGVLQYCSEPQKPTLSDKCRDILAEQNFTQKHINNNLIKYRHTTGMSASDVDSFMFVLSDEQNKRSVETFQIRITNSKKANIVLINKGLFVREGTRVAITTESLSAFDESTRAEEMVFAIVKPTVLGQLEFIDRSLVAINSFTQKDLASGKVVYNHLTKTDFTDDFFTFTVTNGLSDTKDADYNIRIEPLDQMPPLLVVKSLVEVIQGAEVPITALHIRADDPDTDSSNVTYIIAKQPMYGRLYNRGVYITSLFTQSAIDRGFITYESDGTHTGLDKFLFSLTDGRHEGFLNNGTLQRHPEMFSIFIKPLVNDAPRLIIIEHPKTLQEFENGRNGFSLNSRVLKAVDSDTMNSHLVYIIQQKPKYGHIENSEAKRYVRRRFTQRDLDENSLQYIIDEKDKETNDSFVFKIEDSRGNSLDNQRIEFSWSYIEFERAGIVVCENIGTLPLTLIRQGDISTLAFVSIESQDRTTRVNDDYVPSSNKQIQFDPGVSIVSWDMRIIDDTIMESTENVIVYISEPVNAILGRKRKIRIRIINTEHGECPQYLGMVSKHQKELPEALYIPDNSLEGETDMTIVSKTRLTGNTFLSDPAEAVVDPHDSEQIETTPSEAIKKDAIMPNKQSKRRKKRKDKKKNNLVDVENIKSLDVWTTTSKTVENVTIKAPQECSFITEGLLYFDRVTQQMYKCIGRSWQTWNQNQQVEVKDCQQGWSKFESRCFKFINERLTWEVAETLCQMSYEAHLTTVQSQKHLMWLAELSGKKAYWIGLNDMDETGSWKYTNSETISFSNWDSSGSKVKRNLNLKNCVLVDKRKQWKSKICNKRKSRFICEQDIGAGDMSKSPPKRDIVSAKVQHNGKRQTNILTKNNKIDERVKRNKQPLDSNKLAKTKHEAGFFFRN